MRSTRRRRIYTKAWCGLPGALGMLALPALAAASLGAGVGAAPIGLGQSARAGRAYTLPGLYVVNTGTLRSLYHVRVQRLSPGSATTLPAGWVSIERNDFPLAAHQSTIVPLKITIPAKATAGRLHHELATRPRHFTRGRSGDQASGKHRGGWQHVPVEDNRMDRRRLAGGCRRDLDYPTLRAVGSPRPWIAGSSRRALVKTAWRRDDGPQTGSLSDEAQCYGSAVTGHAVVSAGAMSWGPRWACSLPRRPSPPASRSPPRAAASARPSTSDRRQSSPSR